MSHFAKVVNGIVTEVIVAEQDLVDGLEGTWVQTSYNTHGNVHYGQNETSHGCIPFPDGGIALRKNYAGIGDTYDSVRDAFYEPQPFPSWTLNEDSCIWEPPIVEPSEGVYYWDEDQLDWVEYHWPIIPIE